jgi:hypothetical protein
MVVHHKVKTPSPPLLPPPSLIPTPFAVTVYLAAKAFSARGNTYVKGATVNITGWSNTKITQMWRQRYIIPQ